MIEMPAHVGFYRWHVADPIVFAESLRVTIQQIGMNLFATGQDAEMAAYEATNPLAGNGWFPARNGVAGMGLFERVDDYAAAAFIYCREAQSVPRVHGAAASADLVRHAYEVADPLEAWL